MHWIWRALVAGLLLGGTIIWVPTMATAASTSSATAVRAPAGDNHDNDEKDENDNHIENDNHVENDNQAENDNHGEENDNWVENDNHVDNGNLNDNASDNWNDNDSGATGTPVDQGNTGAQVNVDGLTVDLWRSTDYPVVNTPFQLAVTGNGAPIERVWIWAEGPSGDAGPAGDDFAVAGELSHNCGGAQPCAQNWQVVARNVGYYNIHARVRDTSGREVQTDWHILISSNTRSG
jgi:hypothetical protein